MAKSSDKDIAIISNDDIRNKIYTIRGMQVMLDSDLAEIYGYETKNFNRQVKNNIDRFDSDFMFQLTSEDIEDLSRCKNFTLNKKEGRGGNIKYMPYAFTEQGIYMLMSVLKGELAVRQSKMLVRTFKDMKDFIVQRNNLVGTDAISRLLEITDRHTDDIRKIKDTMVTKDELAVVIRDFTNPNLRKTTSS